MAEEKTMINAGKPDVCNSMRDITKELLGTSWDANTCNFAFELVMEAMKRSLFSNGKLTINGFCSFELIWKNPKEMYDPVKSNGEYRTIPEHNTVKVSAVPSFKRLATKVKYKFIKQKSTRGRVSSKNLDIKGE